VDVRSGGHFTTTTYNALTDNNTNKPGTNSTAVTDYRLHEEGKDAGILGWGFNNTLTGGSVQVWWSNNDYTGSLYSSMGLIIEVGSYNGGTPIINNTTTLMGAATATDYTPSNITIPSNISWSYLQIRAVADSSGQDPILWEVRINNIPNV
jgi:hypothetical protein